VTNRGIPGEFATDGEDRLARELGDYNPEVLLIMEGTNDMLGDPVRNEAEAIESLGDMIRIARDRGVSSVFLATIPPVAPGGVYNSISPYIAPFNVKVRAVAAQAGVPLVDVFAALNADLPRYYVGDDVHPTGEALRLIGDLFFAAIRTALDNTPTDAPPAFSPPGLIQPPLRRRR
jgi:lysophospholipase L1-like esterase